MSASDAAATEAEKHRREARDYLKSATKFSVRDEMGAILFANAAAAEASLAVADEVRALRLWMAEGER